MQEHFIPDLLAVEGHLNTQVMISELKTVDMDTLKWFRIQYYSECSVWRSHRETMIFPV